MLRMTEGPAPAALPSRTLEPCLIKPNQSQDSSSGTEGQMEECYLEQVQTMIMGEVLKDVDTACKLLSIASGTGYCHTVTLEYDCTHVQCVFSCNSPLMVQLLLFSRGPLGAHLIVAYGAKFFFSFPSSLTQQTATSRPCPPYANIPVDSLKNFIFIQSICLYECPTVETLLFNSPHKCMQLFTYLSRLTRCPALSSLDPLDWSCVHVQKWLLWTEHLYRLPQVSTMFQELTGRDLCSMTEADFRQRSSQFGDVLYAHLDIWRSSKNCRSELERVKERLLTDPGSGL